MSKSEHRIQDEIRLALSDHGIVLRLNSGKAYSGNRIFDNRRGTYILTELRTIALCPKGTPDLLFIGTNGVIAFIEVKAESGKLREDQKLFLNLMQNYGYRCGVAHSPQEALRIIGINA